MMSLKIQKMNYFTNQLNLNNYFINMKQLFKTSLKL